MRLEKSRVYDAQASGCVVVRARARLADRRLRRQPHRQYVPARGRHWRRGTGFGPRARGRPPAAAADHAGRERDRCTGRWCVHPPDSSGPFKGIHVCDLYSEAFRWIDMQEASSTTIFNSLRVYSVASTEASTSLTGSRARSSTSVEPADRAPALSSSCVQPETQCPSRLCSRRIPGPDRFRRATVGSFAGTSGAPRGASPRALTMGSEGFRARVGVRLGSHASASVAVFARPPGTQRSAATPPDRHLPSRAPGASARLHAAARRRCRRCRSARRR